MRVYVAMKTVGDVMVSCDVYASRHEALGRVLEDLGHYYNLGTSDGRLFMARAERELAGGERHDISRTCLEDAAARVSWRVRECMVHGRKR